MYKVAIGLVIVTTAFLVGTSIALQSRLTTMTHQYETEYTCDQYQRTHSHSDYRECGKVQSKYHTEYICTSDDSACGAEVK